MIRTTRKTVTFSRPFSLSAVDRILPSGTYTVDTDEELIDGLSLAYRRTEDPAPRCPTSRQSWRGAEMAGPSIQTT